MWTYRQSTGLLTHDNVFSGAGYSGRGGGRNNPDMQAAHDVGPIPQGLYHIGPAHDTETHGPIVMALSPQGHNALGRSGFLVHGDNINHDASLGCIIMPRSTRQDIAKGYDRDLTVIE